MHILYNYPLCAAQWFGSVFHSFNPLTTGADYIIFLHFLLACTISAIKHIEDKM